MIRYIKTIWQESRECNNCGSKDGIKEMEITSVVIVALCKDCRRKLKELLEG